MRGLMQEKQYTKEYRVNFENRKIRDKGSFIAREFDRVVETFTKSLEFKEKIRLLLQKEIDDLIKHCNETVRQHEAIVKNIALYDQNLRDISFTLERLAQKEKILRKRYERLLSGSFQDDELQGITSIGGESQTEDTPATLHPLVEEDSENQDNLINRKKKYFQTLDCFFKNLDDELSSITSIRANLNKENSKIVLMREEGIITKKALESSHKRYLSEVKELEVELDKSVDEESFLIEEFCALVEQAGSQIELRQEVDQMLFEFSAAADKDNEALGMSDESQSANGHDSSQNPERPSQGSSSRTSTHSSVNDESQDNSD